MKKKPILEKVNHAAVNDTSGFLLEYQMAILLELKEQGLLSEGQCQRSIEMLTVQ